MFLISAISFHVKESSMKIILASLCPFLHSSPGKEKLLSYLIGIFWEKDLSLSFFEICLSAESTCSPNLYPLDNLCFSTLIMEFRNQFCSTSKPCSPTSALMVIKLTFCFSSFWCLSLSWFWTPVGNWRGVIYLFTSLNSNRVQ